MTVNLTHTEREARYARAREVADTIREQIGVNVLASLGAHDLHPTEMSGGSPALFFRARILPMKADGTRSSAVRNMGVFIWLTERDDYDIRVGYVSRGRYVVHYEGSYVYADQLARILLSLDYDGDTVLNPRIL